MAITDIRNYMYDHRYKKSFLFNTHVINVGNLTVGGTGKTPHVEYLIRLLQKEHKIATLSRGYGRKTKGFLLGQEAPQAESIGDEPMQIYQKFSPEVVVAVGEERVLAIPNILLKHPDTEVILLDDAFQHRAVQPHFNILLTDYRRLFYKDLPFPSGRLRERRKGAKRADIVLVTKCPQDLSREEQQTIQRHILRYCRPATPVYFTGIQYAPLLPVYRQEERKEILPSPDLQVVLFSGIAHSASLEEYVRMHYSPVKHFRFPDHHTYSIKNLENIRDYFAGVKASSKIILTTEKDCVKLCTPELETVFRAYPVYYLPIEVNFLTQKQAFDHLIKERINQKLQE